MDTSSIVCKRAEISGRVQGVWYRGTTGSVANKLALSGWVRNRPDGSVEALFQGPAAAVEEMLAWCHKGPVAARVDRVTVTDETVDPTLPNPFKVRR